MVHTKFQSLMVEEKIFEGFYQIRVWRPSWLYDPDNLCKPLCPHAKEALYGIWAELASGFREDVWMQ